MTTLLLQSYKINSLITTRHNVLTKDYKFSVDPLSNPTAPVINVVI